MIVLIDSHMPDENSVVVIGPGVFNHLDGIAPVILDVFYDARSLIACNNRLLTVVNLQCTCFSRGDKDQHTNTIILDHAVLTWGLYNKMYQNLSVHLRVGGNKQ